jgi:hypothetical protein
VDVTGLAIGTSTVDLRFERTGDQVTLADASIEGDVEVVLEIAGDRRQIVDP